MKEKIPEKREGNINQKQTGIKIGWENERIEEKGEFPPKPWSCWQIALRGRQPERWWARLNDTTAGRRELISWFLLESGQDNWWQCWAEDDVAWSVARDRCSLLPSLLVVLILSTRSLHIWRSAWSVDQIEFNGIYHSFFTRILWLYQPCSSELTFSCPIRTVLSQEARDIL